MSCVCVALVVLLFGSLAVMPSVYFFICVKWVFLPKKELVQPESTMAHSLSVRISTAYAYLHLKGLKHIC